VLHPRAARDALESDRCVAARVGTVTERWATSPGILPPKPCNACWRAGLCALRKGSQD
jgi:hypothetical protein